VVSQKTVTQRLATSVNGLLESNRVPDSIIRMSIRRLLRARLWEQKAGGLAAQRQFIRELRESPIAVATASANQQHYEVPAEFYRATLGKHLKYSSALFSEGVETLDEAEAAMLDLTCRRARLDDDQDILELGCGWGSLTLWMAESYPGSRITAVSTKKQRELAKAIKRARQIGLLPYLVK